MPLRRSETTKGYTDTRLGVLEGRSKLMLRRGIVQKGKLEMNSTRKERSDLFIFLSNVFRAGNSATVLSTCSQYSFSIEIRFQR
jgi:hypothetical protein